MIRIVIRLDIRLGLEWVHLALACFSIYQLTDKDRPDSLPSQSDWLGGWRSKGQVLSEGSSSIKLYILSWLGESGQNKNSHGVSTETLQIRGSSSKEVEEAMPGELSNVSLSDIAFMEHLIFWKTP